MAQKQTDKEKAIKKLTAAVKLFNQKKYDDAKNSFTEIIDSFPELADIVEKAKDYNEIIDSIQETVVQTPRDSEDKMELVVYHYNDGNYEEAERLLNLVLKSDKDPFGFYMLALTKLALKEQEEALKNLEKAIKLDNAYRINAFNDIAFSEMHKVPEFKELVTETEAEK